MEDTTRLLDKLGRGDPMNEGDRACSLALLAWPATFEIASPGVALPAPVRLSLGLTQLLTRLVPDPAGFAWAPVAGPAPAGGRQQQVATATVARSAGAGAPAMPLRGVLAPPGDLDAVLAAALASRFTGTVTLQPRYSSFRFVVSVEGGNVTAASGGGPGQDAGSQGALDNDGDRAFTRARQVRQGTFEATPGDPRPPASARLSERFRRMARRRAAGTRWDPALFTPRAPEPDASPARFPPPLRGTFQIALGPAGSLVGYRSFKDVLDAAYLGRLTGTITFAVASMVGRESREPFVFAFEDGELTGAWGGDPEGADAAKITKEVTEKRLPGNTADRVFARLQWGAISGTYEVTPGRPEVPAGAHVSPETTAWLAGFSRTMTGDRVSVALMTAPLTATRETPEPSAGGRALNCLQLAYTGFIIVVLGGSAIVLLSARITLAIVSAAVGLPLLVIGTVLLIVRTRAAQGGAERGRPAKT